MANYRANTPAFIEDHVYSSFMLSILHDGLLPGQFYRNVTDFGSGTELHIKTIGTVTIQDIAEETPVDYTPIETGEVLMTITDAVGNAFYIGDWLKEDGTNIEYLKSQYVMEQTRAIQETFESRFLRKAATSQVDANPNEVNNFAHRLVGSGTNNTLELEDLLKMKIAFDKANVPVGGRILIVDPVVEASLLAKVGINEQVTPFGAELLANGFDKDHNWVHRFYGWNIISSNRLHKGDLSDGTTTVQDGVANLFMSLYDDNTKPLMAAWRRMPRMEYGRNKDIGRDEYVTTARFGFGTQRLDTLGVLITNSNIS